MEEYDDVESDPDTLAVYPNDDDAQRRIHREKVARHISGSDEVQDNCANEIKSAPSGHGRFGKFGILVALCILVTELCERLTYYGVSGNLVIFCEKILSIGSDKASSIVLAFTGLEFAYSQSPRMLQGVVMGFFLLTSGVGSFVGAALIGIVTAINKDWYPDDPNKGNLEYYFYFLAIVMAVDLIIFCFVARWYTYVTPQTLQRGEIDWKLNIDRISPYQDMDPNQVSSAPNG